MMELRHLRYFVVLAEELHFGRAARRLNITQPPLSQQLRQFEEELGVQLFERSSRRVKLTEAGSVLLGHARETLAKADATKSLVQRATRGEVGTITVGFVSAYPVLSSTLARYRQCYPDVRVVLKEMTTMEQVVALRSQEIDVGFLRPPINEQELETEQLLREPLVAVLPASHRLASESSIELSQLAGEPFIMFPPQHGPGFFSLVCRACQEAGFLPHVVQEATRYETIVALVGGQMGVALAPQSITHRSIPNVLYKPIINAPMLELALAWRLGDKSRVVELFRTAAFSIS